MGKKSDQVPADKLALYRRLIDAHPEIELKGGLKLPYTSYQGNMFSQLTKAGKVGLRMGKTEREAFIATYDSKTAGNLRHDHERICRGARSLAG